MVVGYPRSGTTLIAQHIAASLGIVCFPETHFFSSYFSGSLLHDVKTRVVRNNNISWTNFQKIFGSYSRKGRMISFDVAKASRNFFEFLDLVVDGLDGYSGWLEKTPAHIEYCEEIIESCKDIIVIGVIRKPSDAISSYLHVTSEFPAEWGGKKSFKYASERWVRYCEIIIRCQNYPTFVPVRYEEFVRNPAQIISRVADKLSLSLENSGYPDFPVYGFEKWKNNNGNVVSNRASKADLMLSESELIFCHERLDKVYGLTQSLL